MADRFLRTGDPKLDSNFQELESTVRNIRTSLAYATWITFDVAIVVPSIAANSEATVTFDIPAGRPGDILVMNPPWDGITAGVLVAHDFRVYSTGVGAMEVYNHTGGPSTATEYLFSGAVLQRG